MISLTDIQYTENKDALVYNAYSNDCCSDDFISLFRIMFMIYEWDSTADNTNKTLKYYAFDEKIKEIFNNTCKTKTTKVADDVSYDSMYRYITDFFVKNYNKLTRTNKDVCFCNAIRVLNSNVFFFFSSSISGTNYNLVINGISTSTVNLIQKYLND